MNFDKIELPWPETKDELLKTAGDWEGAAFLWSEMEKWDVYCAGYLAAAESLALQFIGQTQSNDTLIYPILYLYRHYLEIRLKCLIKEGLSLQNESVKIYKGHDLINLWFTFRKLLEQIEPRGDNSPIDIVEKHIRAFNEIDPRSINLRYPETTDGNPVVISKQIIDVLNLKEVMGKTSSFLEAVSSMFVEYESYLDTYP